MCVCFPLNAEMSTKMLNPSDEATREHSLQSFLHLTLMLGSGQS